MKLAAVVIGAIIGAFLGGALVSIVLYGHAGVSTLDTTLGTLGGGILGGWLVSRLL